MRRTRRVLWSLLALTALLLAVEPVAAQDSINEALIWELNAKLLYVAIPITVLVEGILIYAVWRFKGNDDPTPTQENRRLEITWTVATAIILLFVGVASYQVLAVPAIGGVTAADNPDLRQAAVSQNYEGAVGPEEGENAVQVEVAAEKYFWTFNYTRENVTAQGTLVIPANRTVYLYVYSKDWIHSVHVPGLGLKQDAFPGQYNTLKTEAYETGEYQLYCAEYCGVGHSSMLGTVNVVSQQEYQQWLQQQKQGGGGGNQTAGGGGNQTAGNGTGGNQTGGNQSGNVVAPTGH